MNQWVDIALIADCLANNRRAQRRLYDQSLPAITMVCRRYLNNDTDLKDALQLAFISIFQHLDQYDLNRATFSTWANRIAINACLKLNAAGKRARTVELPRDRQEPRVDPEALARLSNEEMITWLQQMPGPYYQVFSLFVIDGFTHQEIAAALGIEVALSRQRLSRARAWLRQRLPEEYRHSSGGKTSRKDLALLPLVLQFAYLTQDLFYC